MKTKNWKGDLTRLPKPKILPETQQFFGSSNSSDLITFEKDPLDQDLFENGK